MDINKLKLPDDWAKDYESPITVQMKMIAQQIEEQRENNLTLKISEQMGVNIDKDELKRALAYDRDQYRRGYEDGWRARSKDVPHWIPVTYRPMTAEERVEFAKHYGIEYCDTSEEKTFDCPMPEDGQEIIISASWGVVEDVADNDIDGEGFICYGLEGNGDWDGVLAWMPKPEPYKEEGETDG